MNRLADIPSGTCMDYLYDHSLNAAYWITVVCLEEGLHSRNSRLESN